MKKHYVTFGQNHRHEIAGKVFDKDCVAVFEATNPTQGREIAFSLFGPKFCFEYKESTFPFSSMRYYPRGFVELTTAEVVEPLMGDEREEPVQADGGEDLT